MNQQSNIFDVLGGRESIKAEVGIPNETIFILCASILAVIVLGALAIKQIKNS